MSILKFPQNLLSFKIKIKHPVNYLIPVLLSQLFLIGCGSDDAKNAADAISNTVKEHNIMGTWQSKCKSSNLADVGASMTDYYKFSGNNFIKASEYSMTADCGEPIAKMQYQGTFKVADETDRVEDARNIDIIYDKAILVPYSQEIVSLLNLGFCGISNWEVGKKQDLTAQSRDTLCPIEDMPLKRFDIAKVEEEVLFFGVGDDNSLITVSKRPDELDRDDAYSYSTHDLELE